MEPDPGVAGQKGQEEGDETCAGFQEGKEPDFQNSLARSQVGLKQETGELVQVRGRVSGASICVTGVLDEPRDREPHPNTVPTQQGLSGVTGSSRPQGAGLPVGQGWVGHRDRQEGEPGSAPMRQDNCLFPVLDTLISGSRRSPRCRSESAPPVSSDQAGRGPPRQHCPVRRGLPPHPAGQAAPSGHHLSALTFDAPCGRAGWPTGGWASLRATLRF